MRTTVEGFLAAYGEGALDITDRFVAPGDRFGWFGDPERPSYPQHPDDDRRETIAGCVAVFAYVLVRSGSVPQPRKAIGKVALGCGTGKGVLWLVDRW